jgi:elongation factor G
LEGEALTEEEVSRGLHAAILAGDIVPVFAGSVSEQVGIDELMNGIVNLFPTPAAAPITVGDQEVEPSESGDGLVLVFKSVTDPFMGQLTYLRVYSGTFTGDSEVHNLTRGGKERFGHLLRVCGKQQEQIDKALPGEIIAVAKLKDTHISDTLSTGNDASKALAPITFPTPTMSFAVYPENKGEEEKIGTGLHKLAEEDPTVVVERTPETKETVLSGMGDQHLNNIVQRLKTTYKVGVNLETPKVPYRETITSTGSAQYRHKKQTGGHGQFAEVHLRVEPLPEDSEEDFVFDSEVVGGNIPKNFIPAVEKGVVETLPSGPLAHCRIIRLKAVVYDGKHHPVDSSEMAFKIAARNALREAMKQAKPILLEPIMKMRIMFPDEYMGDISGDLNSRRGRIMGMEHEGNMEVVNAEVPMAESFTYATQLRSLTQGRGSFELSFERYEPVPANLTQQIMDAAAAEEEEE